MWFKLRRWLESHQRRPLVAECERLDHSIWVHCRCGFWVDSRLLKENPETLIMEICPYCGQVWVDD